LEHRQGVIFILGRNLVFSCLYIYLLFLSIPLAADYALLFLFIHFFFYYRLPGRDCYLAIRPPIVILTTISFYIHIRTYHSRLIPEGVAEASQIFLRDAHVLPKLLSYKEYFFLLFTVIFCVMCNKVFNIIIIFL
jgi:hypothetical protein